MSLRCFESLSTPYTAGHLHPNVKDLGDLCSALKANELRMLDIRFDPRRPGVPIYSVRHVSLDALDTPRLCCHIIHMVERRVQLVQNGATSINAAATE